VSEHDLIRKHLAGALQRVAHVAKEEKFGGRYAVGMRGNPTLADINSSIRKELTQVIVRPAVTQPKFEDLSVQSLDKTGRKIETISLCLQPADEAVEPTHGRSGGNAAAFAQSFDLGKRRAQLMVRQIEPVRQFLHDRDRHGREFADHTHERLL